MKPIEKLQAQVAALQKTVLKLTEDILGLTDPQNRGPIIKRLDALRQDMAKGGGK